MMAPRWTLLRLALGLALALPTTGAAAAPTAEPTVEPSPITAGPALWLRGPFGTVPGGAPDEPAAAAPDDAPLDTWMRGASLELLSEVPLAQLGEVRLWARPTGGGLVEELPRRGRWVSGPDRPGRQIITARVQLESGTLERAWLIDVPDRVGGPETLFEMPALEATLRSAAGGVLGVRGHGCYVGLCQHVGLRPPPASLEPLTVGVGETLELHLSDGSAIAHWEGRLTPLPGTLAEDRHATAAVDDAPQAAPKLAGLEPTVAGDWLLEVRADYDRQRGWQWFLYRLR
ncbi:MAG: hypothetical protein PVG27_14275, partial [Chloroflexota bacterium]